MKTSLDMAMIRWSVVCRRWHEMSSGHAPELGAFLAGWFMRGSNAPMPDRANLGDFPDSFRAGWSEADTQIVILSRQTG